MPDHIAAAALVAWSGLFGLVSFELFGQFENVVTDRAAFFDHAAASLGRLAGLLRLTQASRLCPASRASRRRALRHAYRGRPGAAHALSSTLGCRKSV